MSRLCGLSWFLSSACFDNCLPSLFQSRRNLCEEALLKIKGVISFTFQMAVQRCVVRIRSDLKAEVSTLNH